MYEGFGKQGRRIGKGKLKWMELDTSVEGYWLNDLPDTEKNFLIEYEKNVQYFGKVRQIGPPCPVMFFEEFVREGMGQQKENRVKYFGEFNNNNFNGCGVFMHEPLNYLYFGCFKNNKQHGKGCLKNFRNGTIYLGEFNNGKYKGEGMLFFPEHKMCITGVFSDNGKIKNCKINRIAKFNEELKWDLILKNCNRFTFRKDEELKKLKIIDFYIRYFRLTYENVYFFGYCMEDVVSFIKFVTDLYKKKKKKKNNDEIIYYVNSVIGDVFFSLYEKKYKAKDEKFMKKLNMFNFDDFSQNFLENNNFKEEFTQFEKSLIILNQLHKSKNVIEKIKILETFRDTVYLETKEIYEKHKTVKSINVDILTETFILCFVKSNLTSFFSNYHYVKDWIEINVEFYSSRKIMSVIHFYNGFLNFIEKIYELCNNINIIQKNIKGDYLKKLLNCNNGDILNLSMQSIEKDVKVEENKNQEIKDLESKDTKVEENKNQEIKDLESKDTKVEENKNQEIKDLESKDTKVNLTDTERIEDDKEKEVKTQK